MAVKLNCTKQVVWNVEWSGNGTCNGMWNGYTADSTLRL